MPLDFSGVDTQSRVDALAAKLAALDLEYAALTSSASVSEAGRSINFAQQAQAILDQQRSIREQIALIAGPSFVSSRWRP